MDASKTELGRWGEKQAIRHLKRQGYRIIQRNVVSHVGEIDVVARDRDVLVFGERGVHPQRAITRNEDCPRFSPLWGNPGTVDLMLVDTHGHLDDERFDADRDAVMERAIEAGVAFIINPGTDLDSSRLAVELAEKHDCVYAALGVHPHESGQLTDKACAVLRKLADHEKVVAIGEIGLDYYREFSPREDQREAFRKQLDIASELALPVIVHSRDAHAEVEEMLGEAGRAGKLRGVLHCFSGSPEWAQRAVAMGFHIGFDGPVTYENATKLRKIAAAVPDERLLVETDCPYLPPVPHKRSERNEPAYVRLVAERLAGIRKVSYEDICRVTGLAAARLFGIPSADESGKVAYVIRNSLYLNITNRCSNRCTFCTRQKNAYVKGHRLWLDREPSVEGIIAACGDISHYDEVVFCGYGEPTERLDALPLSLPGWSIN